MRRPTLLTFTAALLASRAPAAPSLLIRTVRVAVVPGATSPKSSDAPGATDEPAASDEPAAGEG